MLNSDYYFSYKNSIKLLMLLKLNARNYKSVLNIPKLSKLNYHFLISRSTDKDTVSIYNYFYLFKFFFGKNAFLSKYRSYYNLGLWYYSFKVSIVINNKQIYKYLSYYINDYLSMLIKYIYNMVFIL
jgi:hypothetical protein